MTSSLPRCRLRWAGLLCSCIAALYASAGAALAARQPARTPPPPREAGYSVINLGADAAISVLNARGQVAFVTGTAEKPSNWFFDGARLHALGSLGGSYTLLKGLNNQGVVVGQSQDGLSDYRAFSWTVAEGMRALPGPSLSDANAINNRSQVVGAVRAEGQRFYTRANRWDPDGSLTRLGPPPARLSTAWAINDSGMSVGESEVQFQDSRAMVWDAAGKATDLGKFGGSQSSARHINANGQVLGTYYKDGRGIGFLWSRKSGMVRIGPDTGEQYVTGLNDYGEVTGNNRIVDGGAGYRYRPFVWTMRGGMQPLPVAGAQDARVHALNKRRQMVGYVERIPEDAHSRRAVLWDDAAGPVDLHSRLHRAPAGLVLYAASAISDDGAIVAHSNAGLVLLRPGKTGTAAPVLGAIAGGPADGRVKLGETVEFSINFVDTATAESHRASASVDDACPQGAPSLRERRGVGDVSLRHAFCRPGVVTVRIKVTDRAGNATQVQRTLSVSAP